VEKYGKATKATDDIIQCVHSECWTPKARDTHSDYVTLIALPQPQ